MILWLGLICGLMPARGQVEAVSAPERSGQVHLRDGRTVPGRLEGSAKTGYRVRVEAGPPVGLEEVLAISYAPPMLDPALGAPPFHALLGPMGQISGRLDGLDQNQLRLFLDSRSKPLTIRRDGVKALVQRPGEAQVIREDFKTLDTTRWSMRVGDPSVDGALALVGEESLKLPSGGSAITTRLSEPIESGRLEVAYFDGGRVAEDQRWFVDLTFRTKDGDQATIRAVPGWTEETIAVESSLSPRGPSLAIQRLLRADGWHRLSVRFGPTSTELTVDGNELAHGLGPGGGLEEIRLATESLGDAEPVPNLSVRLDDLSLVRFGEPSGRMEIEPSVDEVRFSNGDQLFGRVLSAGPDLLNVRFAEAASPVHQISWSEVTGVYFRRQPAQSQPIEGQVVRVNWRSGPGSNPRDLDSVEGVLTEVSDKSLAIDVPFLGALAVPADRVTRIEPVNRARRLVIDPSAYHLGDERQPKEPLFDPPLAQRDPVEIAFELDAVPPGPARLALDVVYVVGVSGDEFSEDVREGKYRTHLKVNGQAIDDLNTAVHTRNITPTRVFLPVPRNLLKMGRNVVRIEQDAGDEERDHLELLGVAIEWPIESSSRTTQP